MSQTAFTAVPPDAQAGQLVYNEFAETRICADANGDIPFGAGVTAIADGKCELPNAAVEITTGGAFAGVALRVSMKEQVSGVDAYDGGEALAVLKRGRVWVPIDGDVVEGTAVFCRFATGTGSQKGAFRGDADTASAAQVPGARWVRAASASTGFAELELNLPAGA